MCRAGPSRTGSIPRPPSRLRPVSPRAGSVQFPRGPAPAAHQGAHAPQGHQRRRRRARRARPLPVTTHRRALAASLFRPHCAATTPPFAAAGEHIQPKSMCSMPTLPATAAAAAGGGGGGLPVVGFAPSLDSVIAVSSIPLYSLARIFGCSPAVLPPHAERPSLPLPASRARKRAPVAKAEHAT
jgi:hypothetical protein